MKNIINNCLIITLCISIICINSCCIEKVDIGMNEVNINEFDTESVESLSKILTKEYNLNDLKSFFEGSNVNEQLGFGSASQNLHYYDINARYPIEVIRPGGYSVYKVSQGGYFYVFWSKMYTTKSNMQTYENDNPFVYFTAYIDEPKDSRIFDSVIPGISTATDIKKIDPYFELNFLISQGIFSYSYLNGENIFEIEYSYHNNINSYDDLIVKEITVISRENASSKYSLILPCDIPR